MSETREDPESIAERLLRRLLAETAISPAQLDRAQALAGSAAQAQLQQLWQDPELDEAAVALALSRETGWPLLDLEAYQQDAAVLDEASAQALLQARLLPLQQQDRQWRVALYDPLQLSPLAQAEALLPVVVERSPLQRALHEAGQRRQHPEAARSPSAAPASGEDESAVALIDRVLGEAVLLGASDVHFEPYAQHYRIRRRLDGELRVVARPAADLAPRLAARLKVLAGLDLAERRLPQDGRIAYRVQTAQGERRVDLRLSSCPTLHGEKICCRILDPLAMPLELDGLGLEAEQLAAYRRALARPQGLILVTGPTGSGKTVSLYAGLKQLNTEARNIATAEDPAEIDLPGINQLNIQPKAGLSFAKALRAFLRQDPDVIMVGEIRDLETAEIAVKAAQTGHLVLSTLHTNDAPQTVLRLLDMGVPAYNLAATLSLIVAQRLLRRLCPACRRPQQLPEAVLRQQGFSAAEWQSPGFQLYEAVGCARCENGYAGRCGVFQVMPFGEAMARQLMQGADAQALAALAAQEQVLSLRRAALRKAGAGIVDLAQVYASTLED